MTAEILSVGTELLMGQIANTDAQYIARRLSELGIFLYRTTVVGDNPARVKEALGEALGRCDIVITTGGLGPTADDLTKEMAAEVFGRKLLLDRESLSHVENYLHTIGRHMAANNEKQAYFPEGATIMPNRCGTAPGCIIEDGDKAVAVLPGPPHEMQDMFDACLAPYLEKKSGCTIRSRFLRIFGIGESAVENLLHGLFDGDNPTLALYCGAGEVKARISARAKTGEEAENLIAPLEREITSRLGSAVYARNDGDTMAVTVEKMLAERGMTVCFAESLTGGRIASSIVDVPGASRVLCESYVTYSNEAKSRILGVSEDTLREVGAVSERCAIEMARGARAASGADIGVSATGIAGPDGGTAEKPVGLVYIGIASREGERAERFRFQGSRDWIRTLTQVNALNLVRLTLTAK